MKRGQLGFSDESRFNTFASNQNAVYAANKSNKIKEAIYLIKKDDDSYYFDGIILSKNLLINDKITMSSNGAITYK